MVKKNNEETKERIAIIMTKDAYLFVKVVLISKDSSNLIKDPVKLLAIKKAKILLDSVKA